MFVNPARCRMSFICMVLPNEDWPHLNMRVAALKVHTQLVLLDAVMSRTQHAASSLSLYLSLETLDYWPGYWLLKRSRHTASMNMSLEVNVIPGQLLFYFIKKLLLTTANSSALMLLLLILWHNRASYLFIYRLSRNTESLVAFNFAVCSSTAVKRSWFNSNPSPRGRSLRGTLFD